MSTLATNVHHTKSRMSVRTITSLAMLCALAYMVMYISKIVFGPITVGGLLTFDLKDVVIAIGGFLFGPLSALAVSAVVSLIEMVTVSETGPVGLLMNVLSTMAFVCPAAALYKRRHAVSGAVIGLVIGGILMTIVMLLWNYLITPLYMNVPRDVVAAMLPTVFLPFNLVKAVMNGALVMVLYKPVVTALRRAQLVPEGQGSGQPGVKKSKTGVTIIAVLVLITAILLALVLSGTI